MVLRLTKKTKIIIGLLGTIVAVPAIFAISESSNNFDIGYVSNVYYSSSAPSIILKNKPNDTSFSSPVSNSEYVKPPVVKKPAVIIKTDEVEAPKKLPKKEEPPKIIKTPVVKKEVQIVKIVQVTPPPPKVKVEDKPATKPKPIVKDVVNRVQPKVVEVPAVIPIPQAKAEEPKKATLSLTPITADTVPQIITTLNSPSSVAKGDIEKLKNLAEERRTKALEVAINDTQRQINFIKSQLEEMDRSNKEQLQKFKDTKASESEIARYNQAYGDERAPWESDLEKEQDKLDRLNNFNVNNFTQDEIIYLKQGQLPSQRSPFEWEYIDPSQDPVVKEGREQNSKRVLNIPGFSERDPESIGKGVYEGWTKQDISKQFSSSEQISGINGTSVSIQEYTPNEKNPDFSTKKPVRQITLDAKDKTAFDSFAELLKTEGDKLKLDIVTIKNIGESETQDISEIIKALPESVQGLNLYVDNTNSLKGLRSLEGRHLKELALLTNNTNVFTTDPNWEINPNAVKDVDLISFDYFDPHDPDLYISSGEQIPSSIIFNTLRWDKNDKIEQVNEGLQIVFGSKIYQRVFEGNAAKKGNYPDNLDFSDSTSIKTLKGIDFNTLDKLFDNNIKNWKYEDDPSITYKKPDNIQFNSVAFGATKKGDNDVYEAQISDFQNANFTTRLGYKGDKAPTIKIKDSTGKVLKDILFYLDGDVNLIQGDVEDELTQFISAANTDWNTFNKIIVSSQEVKDKLGSSISGIPIEVQTS